MIPTRLVLRHFLCYRDPVEVDFTGLQLACLSGENGAGKSALLDAMTWALWEKARASNQHLVSLGELETRVEFSFRLDGREYRVVRAYTSSGKKGSLLELHVRTEDGWYPLASSGKHTVQAEIDRLLGISYSTFVNSVFLLQGRADEFTRQTPAKRKEILAELLELDRYERYREVAREEAKRLHDERTRSEQMLAALREQAAQAPALRDQVTRLENALDAQRAQLAQLREQLKLRQERLYRLQLEVERYRERSARHAELVRECAKRHEEKDRLEQRLATQQAILQRAPEIERRAQELETVQRELDELGRIAAERQRIQQELLQRERDLESKRRERAVRKQALETRIQETEQALAQRPELQARLVQIDEELARLATLRERQAELDNQRVQREARRGELRALANQLRQQMKELQEQLQQLSAIDAVCPVCLRPLTPEERARQEAQVRERGAQLRSTFDASRNEDLQLAKELEEIQQRRRELDAELRREGDLQAERGKIRGDLEKLARQERELAQLRCELEQLSRSEEFDPEYRSLADEVQKLRQQSTALVFDPERHEALERRRRELEPVRQELLQLRDARTAVQHLAERLSELEREIATLETERGSLEAELAAWSPPERELETVRSELEQLKQREQSEEELIERLQSQLGALRQRLTDAEAAQDEAERVSRELDRLAREIAVLETLDRAFGKHGIQTMVFENVLPDLAEAANEILDRLPGNTLRIDFVTQRDKTSGDGAIETLDILISDEFGQRPYELYSGGEAFRINFALRVALSLLLLERAGRRLETLVIDEGFGTQDAKGREGLIQALQSVQDRFALILVITHLEDLKEQFPQRIEVYKTSGGSQVTVIR
ncbi:MAG: SMC family ATPase [Thermomicrobium sp.]|uniref:SMC family ATPase n=1 Tax=Thermomicrobium sp. TaxID=1969469 RepID=UPI001B1AC1B1|nr:SMC family ATPase [Thermomicrobium sp.]MBO9359206.1 SMC family ATPase [Thermomicrobium sp.]